MPADATRWRRMGTLQGVPILLSDSVTVFDRERAAGAIVVSGSHGGRSALAYVTALGLRGVVVNDAGVGKDHAGIAGLASVESIDLAAVAVSHTSARIGDAQDTLASGRISHMNGPAAAAGVGLDMTVDRAVMAMASRRAALIDAAAEASSASPPRLLERGDRPVYAVDSAASVDDALSGSIVITGSHGGATHGRALDARVAAAAFNDAGIGKERAGVARLAILESEGIPGLAVDHDSARIGDALDSWEHGIVSVVNGPARTAGAAVGQSLRLAIHAIVRAIGKGRTWRG